MICQICGEQIQGRSNKRYCGVACRRKAERQARIRKQEQKWLDHLGGLSGVEYDLAVDADEGRKWLEKNCLTMEEAFKRLGL